MRVETKIRKAINTASFEQLKKWWLGKPPDWVESTIQFHYALRKKLWERPEGIQFLKNYARHSKGKRKFQALIDLSHPKIADDEVIHLLTKAFEKNDPQSKYGALLGLRRIKKYTLGKGQVADLVEQHGCLLERELGSQAFLYLVYAFPNESKERLRDGLTSPNDYIRGQSCDEIWQRNIIELAPKVKEMVQENDRYISTAAQNAIEMLEIKQGCKI